MNKTVTVNISGFVFYIEEDAYTVLSTYINRIKAIFQSDEGGDEIVNDVESRIAELFHEKLENKKEVIAMEDVEQVIHVMGKPEDYIEDDASYQQHNSSRDQGSYANQERRKIFRDTDDKVLGGVSSGLAYYFNTEVLLIRILFILLFVLGFSGVFIYIVLWIIVPKAETTAEKLRMQGERVNVENIKKKVNDFTASTGLHDDDGKIRSFIDRFIDFLSSLFGVLAKIITKVIGLFFGLMAIGLLIGLVASLISPDSTLNVIDNSFSIAEIREMVFHGNANFFLSVIGILLLIITPIIGLIYGAIRLISGNKYKAKGLSTSLVILFSIGVFAGATGIIKTAHNYYQDGETESFMTLNSNDIETLHVSILPDDEFHSNLKIDDHYPNYWEVRKLDDLELYNGQDITLSTKSSQSEEFRIKLIKQSQGKNSLDAINFSENINFKNYISNDTLFLAPYFITPREDGFRFQGMKIQIYVPDGKKVSLDKNTSRIELRNVDYGKTYIYEDGFKETFDPFKVKEKTDEDSLKIYKI